VLPGQQLRVIESSVPEALQRGIERDDVGDGRDCIEVHGKIVFLF
jgi:hypothetical protein